MWTYRAARITSLFYFIHTTTTTLHSVTTSGEHRRYISAYDHRRRIATTTIAKSTPPTSPSSPSRSPPLPPLTHPISLALSPAITGQLARALVYTLRRRASLGFLSVMVLFLESPPILCVTHLRSNPPRRPRLTTPRARGEEGSSPTRILP